MLTQLVIHLVFYMVDCYIQIDFLVTSFSPEYMSLVIHLINSAIK